MLKQMSITALLITATLSTFAQQPTNIKDLPSGDYYVDKNHASLTFKVNHLGLSNYTMRFTDFDAVLTYNPSEPIKSKVEVNINPLSIKTDFTEPNRVNFDQELANKKEWLNATKFPTITFKSKNILISEDNKTGVVIGDLTMLGITKPVSLRVTLNGSYKLHPMTQLPSMGFSATAEFNRKDWGMDYLTPNVGEMIQVIIEIEFIKKEKA